MIEVEISGFGKKNVSVNKEGNTVILDDISWNIEKKEQNTFIVSGNNKLFEAYLTSIDTDRKKMTWQVNGQYLEIKITSSIDKLLTDLGISTIGKQKINEIKAPMPGLIRKILSHPGDILDPGSPVLILEAMKMENIIKSPPVEVKVKKIMVEEGKTVDKGSVMILFE